MAPFPTHYGWAHIFRQPLPSLKNEGWQATLPHNPSPWDSPGLAATFHLPPPGRQDACPTILRLGNAPSLAPGRVGDTVFPTPARRRHSEPPKPRPGQRRRGRVSRGQGDCHAGRKNGRTVSPTTPHLSCGAAVRLELPGSTASQGKGRNKFRLRGQRSSPRPITLGLRLSRGPLAMLSLAGMVSGKITIQHFSDLELGAKNRFGGAEGPLQDGGRRQSGWVGCQVLRS